MVNKYFAQQDNAIASILTQLQSQTAQQALMQRELDQVKQKLEMASKTLADKDQIIGSLELDLEHMIDQLVKFQHNRGQAAAVQETWLSRAVSGLSSEPSGQVA